MDRSGMISTALQIAERSLQLYSAVGAATLGHARRGILDSIGVAIAGRHESGVTMLRQALVTGHGPAQARVLGSSERVSAEAAALANGAMISVLLYDDSNTIMEGHPSAPVLPAVLAIGEMMDRSVAEALRAYVIGYEIEGRLGESLAPSHYRAGWHATGTLGTFGAAVAAGLLLDLDAGRMAQAIAIAASMASGLRTNFGTMTMSLHSGEAAAAGIRAARLAAAGFSGSDDVFAGEIGFGHLVSKDWDEHAFRQRLSVWGQPFLLDDPGTIFKFVPCGTPTVPVIDAVAKIRAGCDVKAEDVAAIRCDVSFMYPRTLIHPRPSTGLQARTSLEYCVASTLVDGWPVLASFTDEAVMRPAIRRLIETISLHVPEELSEEVEEVRRAPFRQPVTVTIRMNDGREFRETIRNFLGTPENPGSDADHLNKLFDCFGSQLSEAGVREIIKCLDRDDAKVRELMSLIAASDRVAAPPSLG